MLCTVKWGKKSLLRWIATTVHNCTVNRNTVHKATLKLKKDTNLAPNISRSSDSFSTVLAIVDWGCIVRELETIIVFLLFSFIPV